MKPISLVVLISGSGSNLQAIIDSIESKFLNAEIKAVISNRPEAYGLSRALNYNIPAIALDHKNYVDRITFDQVLLEKIEAFKPDLVILAGYMRILSTQFINHLSPRLINIHPSLLPKYQGLNTHQRVLNNNESTHGVSIHIVTPELDAGPVIIQGSFTVEKNDTSSSLQQKAHLLEHQMYPLVILWFSEQRLKIESSKIGTSIIFDGQNIDQPLKYNELISKV